LRRIYGHRKSHCYVCVWLKYVHGATPGTRSVREAIETAGLTADICRAASGAELFGYARPEKAFSPADDAATIEAALEPIARQNGAIKRRLIFWEQLGEFIEGDGDTTARMNLAEDGATVIIETPWQIHPDWLDGPVLHLDATLHPDIARAWLPRLVLRADIRVEPEHAIIRQVVEAGISYGKIVPGAIGGDEATKKRNLRKIYNRLEITAAETNGDVLDVLPMKAKEYLLRKYVDRIPKNLNLAHFGALRGINSYKTVAHAVIISRPEPPPYAVETIARVYSNKLPSTSGLRMYDKILVRSRARNGAGGVISTTCHPDPLCNAVLNQIRESEVEQAIQRARPVRRTADNRVKIDIVSNCVLDVTVDETIGFDEWLAEADPVSLMIARGFLPNSWQGVAAALPDLYETGNAAKCAFKRDTGFMEARRGALEAAKRGQLSRRWTKYRRLTPFPPKGQWCRFRYKKAGARRSHTVWINTDRHQDAQAAWQRYAGPLAAFEAVDSAPPQQAAAPAVEAVPAAKPATVPTPAQQEPPAAPAAEPSIGIHEIRERLGISTAAFRMKKDQGRFRRLAGHDREVALLQWMASKAGPERFRQVVDALKSDSAVAGAA